MTQDDSSRGSAQESRIKDENIDQSSPTASVKPRLHQIHVAGYKLYPLVFVSLVAVLHCKLSCIGDKTVVTAACIHLYDPRVEHCLELVSVDM